MEDFSELSFCLQAAAHSLVFVWEDKLASVAEASGSETLEVQISFVFPKSVKTTISPPIPLPSVKWCL